MFVRRKGDKGFFIGHVEETSVSCCYLLRTYFDSIPGEIQVPSKETQVSAVGRKAAVQSSGKDKGTWAGCGQHLLKGTALHSHSLFLVLSLIYGASIECRGFPGGSDSKQCLQCKRPGFDPWIGKIPWSPRGTQSCQQPHKPSKHFRCSLSTRLSR